MTRMRTVKDLNGPEQWFRSLPVITQHWFGAVVATTVAANFGLVHPDKLMLDWDALKDRVELWRIVTCFLYMGRFSFATVMNCYMLVIFSQKYEGGVPFNTGAGGGTADYAFCLLFAMATILVTYPVLRPMLTFNFYGFHIPLPPLFAENLVCFVLYLWSKRNPTTPAKLWVIPVTGNMLPFAYLALTVVTGNPYMIVIHGYLIAHVYYFLADVLPQVQGREILVTPQFLVNCFGVGEYRRPADAPVRVFEPKHFLQVGARAAPARGGGHNWGGGGRALGRQ